MELTGSELVGVQLIGVYDGVALWQCLLCGGWWHRFSVNDPLRARVDSYLAARGVEVPW